MRGFGLGSIAAFWASYVVTRPLGASYADWISKPVASTGLGFGDGPTAIAFAVSVFLFVAYLAVAKPDIRGAEHASKHHVKAEAFGTERYEIEAMLARGTVRNAPPEDFELLVSDGHLDTRDVCRRRLLRVRELDAVRLGASDHSLLFFHG